MNVFVEIQGGLKETFIHYGLEHYCFYFSAHFFITVNDVCMYVGDSLVLVHSFSLNCSYLASCMANMRTF